MSDQKNYAIIGLIINIILLPGLGSVIGGRTNDGIFQLILFLAGIPLFIAGFIMLAVLPLAGFLMIIAGALAMPAAWIWALFTGIIMVTKAK